MKRSMAMLSFVWFGLWAGMGWAATSAWDWARQADTSAASSSAAATAVVSDAAGNTYVAGTYSGTVRVGAHTLTGGNYTDVFLVKYDSGGAVLWASRAGGMACEAGGLATDGSEVFLTGHCVYGADFDGHGLATSATYDQAFFLVAADAATGRFSRLLTNAAGGGMSGAAVALDANGNVLVAGTYTKTTGVLGSLLAATGGGDAFVFKVNKAFDRLAWLRGGGGEGSDHAYALAVDAAGNVFIAGDILADVGQGSASFGGTTLTVPTGRAGDPFIAKLNGDGEWQWARSISGRGFDEARALAADGAGNVYVAGRFAAVGEFGAITLTAPALNSYAAFVAKLDAAGNFLWAQQAGSTDRAALSDHASAYGLALRDNGNPVATGHYRGTTAFGSFSLTALHMSDVFVAELDAANGSYLWVKSAGGGSGNDAGNAIALAPDGRLLVAGSYEDSADFDATRLTTGRELESWDVGMYLASLDPAATATTLDATLSASGPLTARTLTLTGMSVPAADLAGGVSLYIAAYVDGNFCFLDSGGWTTQMQPYSAGIASLPGAITVTDGLDLSGLVGTTVWFGYGRGTGEAALNDMLQGARYKQVHTIQ